VYDITSLFEIIAAIAVVVAPPILLIRLLADGKDVAPVNLFAIPVDPPWPRGVQEEDSPRWRVELIEPPRRAADQPEAGSRAPERPWRHGECLPTTTSSA
jgi:hypothetical protein